MNFAVCAIDWMVSCVVHSSVDWMVHFGGNNKLEVPRLGIIELRCQQQNENVKIGHHCCRQPGFVCLANNECPTTVKWISMSARFIEWSAEWLTQMLMEWLTSMSAADWKCQDWKSLMQTRRIALSIYLKIHQMVDAEVDGEVDWTVDSMVH